MKNTSVPIIRTLIRKISFYRFKKRYRSLNKHNKTVPMNIFPLDVVSVGKYSYGEINILSYCSEIEKLEIGNNVSIAPKVYFILGGNHQISSLFTFPIKSILMGEQCMEDAQSCGAIIVEDDVWIGFGVTILSGVTIGKGAIIGACSVVTKDVQPFTIVCGNPAKEVRKRFSNDVIDLMKNVSLVDFTEKEMKRYLPLFYKSISNIDDLK